MTSLPTHCDILNADLDGPQAIITINNPDKHNIMTLSAWRAIPELIQQLTALETVHLIIFRGAGEKAFVAGADISEFDDQFAGDGGLDYDGATVAAFDAIRHCPKPTLAAITGFCLGGGLGLALSCDIRFARADSVFGIPAARLGLAYPASALHHLQHLIGRSAAADILFSARQLDAPEAHQLGLIQHIIAPDQYEEALHTYCSRITANAPLTIQAAKYTLDHTNEAAQTRITEWALRCLNSADYREGRTAFKEKRRPIFKGR